MNLDKLRSLTEQASPGEWTWRTGESFDNEWGDKGHGAAVLDAEGNIEGGPLILFSGDEDDDERGRANIRLASLVKHLLPIAEVVHCSHDHNAGTEECLESDACTVPCPQCKALNDLMEALE